MTEIAGAVTEITSAVTEITSSVALHANAVIELAISAAAGLSLPAAVGVENATTA